MKKNVGTTDTIIRLLLVVLIGILYFTDVIGGTLAIVMGIIAVILLLTGLVGFCPLYLLFGISTDKKAPEK